MKMLMMATMLWFATSAFGQAPPQAATPAQAQSKVTCPCGRECDGNCQGKGGRCGRGMRAGRMQGQGRGRMMMGNGFRGGMRGGAPQSETAPKK